MSKDKKIKTKNYTGSVIRKCSPAMGQLTNEVNIKDCYFENCC
jgi:hypothetical protein